MGSTAAAVATDGGDGGCGGTSFLDMAYGDLEKQRALITSCTHLWKELTDHFTSLEKDLDLKFESVRSKFQSLDHSTEQSLASLRHREQTLDSSIAAAVSKIENTKVAALAVGSEPDPDDLVGNMKYLCRKMDFEGFWDLVTGKRKEVEAVRRELEKALGECVDPATFAMNAMARVFPVDQKAGKNGANDYGWACVMILESLVPLLADPEIGMERLLVTPKVREMAVRIAEKWKEGLEQRGGVESAKPPDVHTFLQHVVTFGIVAKEDKELYRKLVVSSSWRRQMPKLALSLGLGDIITDIIDELISKGQQLDAVNFAYEASLVDIYPPVPLLKSYLDDAKKAATTILEDRNNSGRALHLAGRKEQSALRAVIKCIEDHKLGSEFPPDTLQKQLELLEKAKVEKKRPATIPANKRTRANSGGPMPPAKAGRLTNHVHVPSFTAPPSYVRSPSHSPYRASMPPAYVYDISGAAGAYGSQSPPAVRDPYPYGHDEVVPPPTRGMSFRGAPVNYPIYSGYGNGFAPGYHQQAYYLPLKSKDQGAKSGTMPYY